MANEAIQDFLGEITPDIFKEEIQEPATVEEIVDEKPLPFHKDPKVQRYVEKEVKKALESHAPERISEIVTPSDVKDVITAFTEIIGNDTPEKVKALNALEKTLQGADERASQKAIERFQKQQEENIQKAADENAKALEELETSIDEIEETYKVDLSSNSTQAKATRSQFIDYVRKIAPKDANGEVSGFPDLIGAFEDFQDRQKRAPATRAKELANRGLTRSSDAPETLTRPKSWSDVDKMISGLSKK